MRNGSPQLAALFVPATLSLLFAWQLPVLGQAISGSPISSPGPILAQVAPPPTMLPTDVTPQSVQEGKTLSTSYWQFQLFKKLPERLWFTGTVEASQRFESNINQTYGHPLGDYIFRAEPTVTIGYNILKHTSVYGNYFLIKDVFAIHQRLTLPTTQSVSWGIRQDIPLTRKLMGQLDFQARELWQASHLRQADLLPTVTLTYSMNPSATLFASSVLQMRSGSYFQGATRELDPFYTAGAVFRKGLWTASLTNTFITNYREPHFRFSIPPTGNVVDIADFEIDRPVMKKFPSFVSFIRAEPVWNWRGDKQPGLSGFDFRIFGGVRVAIAKQSYGEAVDTLRQQIIQSEQEKQVPAAPAQPLSK